MLAEDIHSLPRGPLCRAAHNVAACFQSEGRECPRGQEGGHGDGGSEVPPITLAMFFPLEARHQVQPKGANAWWQGCCEAFRGCLPQVPAAVRAEAFLNEILGRLTRAWKVQ